MEIQEDADESMAGRQEHLVAVQNLIGTESYGRKVMQRKMEILCM